jgi:hypothetical protein
MPADSSQSSAAFITATSKPVAAGLGRRCHSYTDLQRAGKIPAWCLLRTKASVIDEENEVIINPQEVDVPQVNSVDDEVKSSVTVLDNSSSLLNCPTAFDDLCSLQSMSSEETFPRTLSENDFVKRKELLQDMESNSRFYTLKKTGIADGGCNCIFKGAASSEADMYIVPRHFIGPLNPTKSPTGHKALKIYHRRLILLGRQKSLGDLTQLSP